MFHKDIVHHAHFGLCLEIFNKRCTRTRTTENLYILKYTVKNTFHVYLTVKQVTETLEGARKQGRQRK